MSTASIVTEVLALISGKPAEVCADPGQRLFDGLAMDSLALLETIETLQERTHCIIPDEVTGQVKTVGELQEVVARSTRTVEARIARSEEYLRGHESLFYERKSRFAAAADRLRGAGLGDTHILVDVGAGLTELDVVLRVDHGWRGRYVPVDAWVDGTDLTDWTPPRAVEWFAALEVLEHLLDPEALVERFKQHALSGFVITTPNPDRVDVLAMDPTHVTPIDQKTLRGWGMRTTLHNFYGAYQDGIAAVWVP